MSRTVKLNPLAVLVSVLVGVELFGFLGALLAIPAAGVIQVVVRDVYDEQPRPARGRSRPSAPTRSPCRGHRAERSPDEPTPER